MNVRRTIEDDLRDGYLHKSAMFAYLECPRRFKYEYVWKTRVPAGLAAEIGKDFHEWTRTFFDRVDVRLMERMTYLQTYRYFRKFLPENPALLRMCEWFVEFEARRWSELRDRELWMPVFRERYFRSDTLKLAGFVDRVDRTIDGKYIVIDYKTTKGFDKSKLRKELAFYVLLIQTANEVPEWFDRSKIHYIGIINPAKGIVWYEELKKVTVTYLLKSLRKVREGIENGRYDPKPNGCAYCPFYDICMEEGL